MHFCPASFNASAAVPILRYRAQTYWITPTPGSQGFHLDKKPSESTVFARQDGLPFGLALLGPLRLPAPVTDAVAENRYGWNAAGYSPLSHLFLFGRAGDAPEGSGRGFSGGCCSCHLVACS